MRPPLRRRPRRRDERGAVAVEAALVIPLLVLLVFGMIEMAFAVRDYASVSAYTRAGVRIASTAAGAGPASATTCGTTTDLPPCAPLTTPALAQLAADAVQRSGSALPPDAIESLMVYKANDKGYPGADGSTTMPETCLGVANCVLFTWQASRDQFRYNSGAWASASISACFPGVKVGTITYGLDRVGVAIKAKHKMVTNLFGSDITMRDRTVMNFEPLRTDECMPTKHQ